MKSRTNVIDISTGRGFQCVEQVSIEALEHALFLRFLRRCQVHQALEPWQRLDPGKMAHSVSLEY
jgi:hypothetical protein